MVVLPHEEALLRTVMREEVRDELRRILEIAIDTGTATGGTSTTLVDTTKSWSDNIWTNLVVEIVFGTGAGQIRKITANTADTLTVDPTWTTTPDETSRYAIRWFGIGVMELPDKASRVLGQITDGTAAIAPSAFGSGTHPRDVTDKAARILGQITDGTSPIAPSAFGSGTHPRNISQIGGTAQTGRDWSTDLAKLDIALSALRDALLDIKAAHYLGVENVDANKTIAIASGEEVDVKDITVKSGIYVYIAGILRVHKKLTVEEGSRGLLIEEGGTTKYVGG